MNETELENELRALRPAAPSPELGHRIAAALESRIEAAPARAGWNLLFRWWAERLLWAGGGAVAAAFTVATFHHAPPTKIPGTAVQHEAPMVAAVQAPEEEPLGWTDEGVRFIGDQIPARLLRRVTLESRRNEDGSVKQIPREDVVVVPAVLR